LAIRADYPESRGISGFCRLVAGLIGNRTTSQSGSNQSRRRTTAYGQIAVFLAFFGLAGQAWPEQNLSPAPILAADAALPSAQTPVSPAQKMPGQALLGSIHGVVKDKDGDVCEGARIDLKQTAPTPPTVRTAITGSDGRYDFVDVPAGAFQITITSEGFATQVISGLLQPGESYEAPPVAFLVTATLSEVRVTASQQEIAQEQFKEEEQQRVLGFIPNFYVSYAPNAPPLTPRQKFDLAWRTSIDPVTFLASGFFAGIEQAGDSLSGYGQGSEGYGKRFASNYANNFINTMIGDAMLPSLLKQDPRYFYKGTGTKRSRVLYAIEMSVVCKGDNKHWQMNYSGIGGDFAAAGISNLYYPAANRNGVSLTFENVGYDIAEGVFQNIFQEFVVRKLTPKLPKFVTPSE
jgi:hypothetical protein